MLEKPMVDVRRHNSTEHRIEVENNLAETIKWRAVKP